MIVNKIKVAGKRGLNLAAVVGTAVVALLAIGPVDVAFADTIVFGSASGSPLIVPLSPEMDKKITVILPVADKNKQELGFELIAPPGTAIKIASRMASVSSAKSGTRNAKQEFPLTLYTTTAEANVLRVGEAVPGDVPDPTCGCYTRAQIQEFIAQSGNTITRDQFCELIRSGSAQLCAEQQAPQQNNAAAYKIEAATFLRRNACEAGGHQVLVDLDLSSVANDSLTGDLEFRAQALMFDGNRRASIKPRSDGGIFPGQALLLASPVTIAGTEIFFMKNKSMKASPVRLGDIVFYNGWPLLRVPISKYMKGGKGTFEVRRNGLGYSICAKLTRTRQNFNGYRTN